jgi:hypothetical protein
LTLTADLWGDWKSESIRPSASTFRIFLSILLTLTKLLTKRWRKDSATELSAQLRWMPHHLELILWLRLSLSKSILARTVCPKRSSQWSTWSIWLVLKNLVLLVPRGTVWKKERRSTCLSLVLVAALWYLQTRLTVKKKLK